MLQDSFDQGVELGGMAFSCVVPSTPAITLRLAHCYNLLKRFGLRSPFWALHDLGALCIDTPAAIQKRRVFSRINSNREHEQILSNWKNTLIELSKIPSIRDVRRSHLSDFMLAALLLRLLRPIGEKVPFRSTSSVPIDIRIYNDLDSWIERWFHQGNRLEDIAFLRHITSQPIRLLIAFESIDLNTLRLFSFFGVDQIDSMSLVDIINAFEFSEVAQIARFTLNLLPSLLETKRLRGAQTHAVGGYVGIARHGSIDSLVPTELAYDSELFALRFLENETAFYLREKQKEEERTLHYILIDSSASMRGLRSVFARGLGIGLIKTLEILKEDICFRFFDSQLYESHLIRGHQHSQNNYLLYLLTFRGEHGRNYAKVFSQLALEVENIKQRTYQAIRMYLVTHAECHIPLKTIDHIAKNAKIYGIFILPSDGNIDLEYLDKLYKVQIVTESILLAHEESVERARHIVEELTKTAGSG